MSRFDDMARETKQASEATIAAERAAADAERKARDEQFDADVLFLEREVRPIFDEAAQAFASTGVICRIATNWNAAGRPMHPAITFKCEGEQTRIPQTGGHYTPAGVIVAVAAEAGNAKVKVGKDNFDRFGSIPIAGIWQEALEKGLRKALETYHQHVAEHAARF